MFFSLEFYLDTLRRRFIKNDGDLNVLRALCDPREGHVSNSGLAGLNFGGLDVEDGLELLLIAVHVLAGTEEELLEGLDLLGDCTARAVLGETAVGDLCLDGGGKGVPKDYGVNKGHVAKRVLGRFCLSCLGESCEQGECE